MSHVPPRLLRVVFTAVGGIDGYPPGGGGGGGGRRKQ